MAYFRPWTAIESIEVQTWLWPQCLIGIQKANKLIHLIAILSHKRIIRLLCTRAPFKFTLQKDNFVLLQLLLLGLWQTRCRKNRSCQVIYCCRKAKIVARLSKGDHRHLKVKSKGTSSSWDLLTCLLCPVLISWLRPGFLNRMPLHFLDVQGPQRMNPNDCSEFYLLPLGLTFFVFFFVRSTNCTRCRLRLICGCLWNDDENVSVQWSGAQIGWRNSQKSGKQSAEDLPTIPLVVHAVPSLGIILRTLHCYAGTGKRLHSISKIIEDNFWISSCIIQKMRGYIMIDFQMKVCNPFFIDLKYKSQKQFKFEEPTLTRSTIILWTSN